MSKTKALISFAVTAKLICVFVFAYADCWFSHDAAPLSLQSCTVQKTSFGYFRSVSLYMYKSGRKLKEYKFTMTDHMCNFGIKIRVDNDSQGPICSDVKYVFKRNVSQLIKL